MKAKAHNEAEHLFIKNPISGKFINVLPILNLISNVYGSSEETAEQLQEVHDYLSTHVIQCADSGSVITMDYYAQMNATLVLFRQAFQKMREVPA